MLFLGRKK